MMKQKEIVKFLKDNCTDLLGNIVCDGLDFGRGVSVFFRDIKVDGTLDISGANVTGNLFQNFHKVDGDVYQTEHTTKGKVFQDEQPAKKVTKEELVQIIKENFRDEDGDIKCDGLDFGTEKNVSFCGITVDGNLYLNLAKVTGDLCQDGHRVKKCLHQCWHTVNGNIAQEYHTVHGDLWQRHTFVGKDIIDNSTITPAEPERTIKSNIHQTTNNEPTIKDSGTRREFSSGAVRDMAEGKGRCDLLPLSTCDMLCLDDNFQISTFSNFITATNSDRLEYIKQLCISLKFKSFYDMMLEVSIHFEDGAKKYGVNNWQKGIPRTAYVDSATRHYLKFKAGHTDERHDRACMWNVLCLWWTIENIVEED